MTAFNVLERLALFSLSAAIGLVDLAAALFVAAYLGVIPKDKVSTVFEKAARMPYIGRFVDKNPPVKSAAKSGPTKASPKKRR